MVNDMDRNTYLNLTKQYHMNNKVMVKWQNSSYFPYKYEMSFDSDGNVINTAVLLDENANCYVYAKMDNVEEVKNE